MNDDELDALLLRARAGVSRNAEATARVLARETVVRELGGTRRARGRWSTWRVLLPTGAAVLALTAAGTVAAAQLNIPPFQTTEPGIQRIYRAVPVDYQLTSGRRASCDAFVETRGASGAQLRRIEAMIASTNWAGYGQRTYAQLPAGARAVTTAPGPIADVVLSDLKKRALAAAPGSDVTGGAISCSYGPRTDAPK